jgi:hypothetical protein
VALFLKGGMTVGSKELHDVLTDKQLVRKAPSIVLPNLRRAETKSSAHGMMPTP